MSSVQIETGESIYSDSDVYCKSQRPSSGGGGSCPHAPVICRPVAVKKEHGHLLRGVQRVGEGRTSTSRESQLADKVSDVSAQIDTPAVLGRWRYLAGGNSWFKRV